MPPKMTPGNRTIEVSKKGTPTRYPGVHRISDTTFRVRGRVKNPKTGESIDLDKLVEADDPDQAYQQKLKLLADIDLPRAQARERPTLQSYANSWYASKLPSIKPSTRELYATILDNYVTPVELSGSKFGDYFVDAITLDDLVQWRDLQLSLDTKYGSPPSPASVNGRIRVLKQVIRDAVADLGLERDPTLRLESVREGKKRKNSLSADELHRFLEAAKQHTPQWYPFFYTLAFTGLRFGEITNLRWRDIDEKAGVIVVESAQWKGQEAETKTGEDRYPPLFPELLTILRDHRAAQLKARKKKAKREQVTQWDALTIGDDDLIFVAPRSNTHMHNTAPRKALLACIEKAGIDRRFTVHGSRHTFNNLLRRSTKDLTLVRSMMGHSEGDGKITDRYSDVGNEEKRAAVTGLVVLVGGAGKGPK